jgi:tetratricopeptide (TPR) repeat protein
MRGEYDKAVASYDEAICLEPKMVEIYCDRGTAYHEKGEDNKAVVDYTEAIRLDSQFAQAYCFLAWVASTSKAKKMRNEETALRDARKACELTDWKDWVCLACLAAASAEASDFMAAIKWQKQALELLGETAPEEILAIGREYLSLYEKGKTVRGGRFPAFGIVHVQHNNGTQIFLFYCLSQRPSRVKMLTHEK